MGRKQKEKLGDRSCCDQPERKKRLLILPSLFWQYFSFTAYNEDRAVLKPKHKKMGANANKQEERLVFKVSVKG